MRPDIDILNLNDIEDVFDSLFLTDKEGAGIKRAMLKDALKPINDTARTNLSSMHNEVTGNLKKSLGVIAKVRKETAYAASGARTSGNYKGYHFHFANSGTKVRSNSKGANRGMVTGSGFYDQAIISNLPNIQTTLQEAFNRRLNTFMDKKY